MPWYQLTYGSSDDNGPDPGGWQIQGQAPADMPESIREQLRAHVVTRLREVVPTDEFASSAELEARTRRLLFCPVEDGLAWWHAAPAGKDATGRPGNVFTHGVLLTQPAGPLRPIDLWRSPDWLAPFGAGEVARACIGEFGRPGPLDREAAVVSIHAHAEALESLVAAVTWMFEEPGRHVVLVTDTVDEFALWVSAVSHLTAPALARQIPFVTFERPADGRNTLPSSGFIGVPMQDAADLRGIHDDDILVLRLGELPEEPVDGFWEYDGQRWPVDPLWQDALYGASGLEAEELRRVLEIMDEIAAPIEDRDWMSPGWPLALALLKVAPQRVQERDRLVVDWQRLQPWDGLLDLELLQMLKASTADTSGRAHPATQDAASGPDIQEMRVLLAAAERLVHYRESLPSANRSSVNPCIHLLLTHGLPEQPDLSAVRRAEAYLALGNRVPAPVRSVLLDWEDLASMSRASRESTDEWSSNG